MRALLAFTAAATLLLVLAIAALCWMPAVGTPSAKALHYSLTLEADGSTLIEGLFGCQQRSERIWSCKVADASNSGHATYRVQLDGRCWKALKVRTDGEEVPLKRRASGCVDLRDQVRLLHRLL